MTDFSFDMQLARGVNDGYINLAIGENHLLQNNLVLPSRKTTRGENQYPAPQGDPMLIKEIQNLYPNQHIVVANGAKQALLASLYAFRMAGTGEQLVYHDTPYWPSFPTLAHLEKFKFIGHKPAYDEYVSILTLPNNPNGYVTRDAPQGCDIWDAAYASEIYGFKKENAPVYNIKVESASKMFGLSGLRIGWLITPFEDLAISASEYVELHTSGVSVPSQRKVAACLAGMDKLQIGFDKARRELLINAGIFWSELGGFVDRVEGVPSNGSGMFSWFTVFPDVANKFEAALETAKVRLIKGEACGMPGWWRMSMAQTNDLTYQALSAIKKAVHDR